MLSFSCFSPRHLICVLKKSRRHIDNLSVWRTFQRFHSFLFQRADLPGARTGGLPPIGGSPSRGARIFFLKKHHPKCFIFWDRRINVIFQERLTPLTSDLATFSLSSYLRIDELSILRTDLHLCPPIWLPFRLFPM